MKTFRQFILICEKLNKTFDEDAHTKVWNYFIANPDYIEVRDALVSGDRKKAFKLMMAEIEKSRKDANHPLNFAKADDSEFSTTGTGKNKKPNREASDEKIFNQEIEKAVSGVRSLAGQKKFRDAVEKGFPARKTGGSKAELSRGWKSGGGTNATPKADIEVYDPNNEKNRRGVSLKKAGGSQIASAEAGELQATYKAAAKSFVQRFYGDKPKEERLKIEKEINDAARRVGEINTQQKTSSDDDQKTQLKDAGQEILDKLHDKYPNLTRLVTQASTTGDKKFRGKNAPGSAGTILTGDKAKPAEQQPSARPRNAKPKEKGRPGNVKIDNKEAPTKSNQAQPQQGPISRKAAERRQRIEELKLKKEQEAQTAAAEEQAQQAAQAIQITQAQAVQAAAEAQAASEAQAAAEKEVQAASIPIDPETGAPVLNQYRKNMKGHLAADPTTPEAQVNSERRQAANANLTAAQNNTAAAQNNLQITQNNAALAVNQAAISAPVAPEQPIPATPSPEQPIPAAPAPEQPMPPAPVAPEQPIPAAPTAEPSQTPAPQEKPKEQEKKPEEKNKKEKKAKVEVNPEQPQ